MHRITLLIVLAAYVKAFPRLHIWWVFCSYIVNQAMQWQVSLAELCCTVCYASAASVLRSVKGHWFDCALHSAYWKPRP